MANEFIARNGLIAQNNSTVSGSLTVTAGITGSLLGTSSYAATSSYADNFTVAGTLTAQTLVVQTITSSIVYSSGSNIFGNALANTQTFTGSMYQTGSVAAFMGNVGVGTSTPAGKLHIAATSGVASPGSIALAIRDVGSPTFGFDFNLEGVSTGDLSLMRVVSGVQSQVMTFDRANGNVGIGVTNPSEKLSVYGNIKIDSNNEASLLKVYDSGVLLGSVGKGNYAVSGADYTGISMGSQGAMSFASGGTTERMRITSGGNVGIGITNPGSLLQVGPGTSNSPSPVASLGGTASGILSALSLVNTTGNSAAGYGTALDFHVRHDYSPTGRIATLAESTDTPAALAFYTYNSGLNEKMRITSAGNVGIGTTNPTYKLHTYGTNPRVFIQDSSTGFPILQLNNNSGNFYMSIDNSGGSAFGSAYGRYIYSEGAYPMIFVTNDVERIRILSGGNVGIGTTNPIGKLTVKEADTSLEINTDANGVYQLAFNRTTSAFKLMQFRGSDFRFAPSDVEKVRINASGDLLVGTTTSIFNLSNRGIVQVNGASTAIVALSIGDSAKAYLYHNGTDLSLYSYTGNTNFANTNGNVLTINGTNVGIGITNPSARLQVSGGDNTLTVTGAAPSSAYAAFIISQINSGFGIYDQATKHYFAGNVGIGTTNPGYKLDVQSGSVNFRYDQPSATSYTYFRNWASGGSVALLLGTNDSDDTSAEIGLSSNVLYLQAYGDPGSSIQFGTRNSSTSAVRMTINQDGNVGIGTASPIAPLTVLSASTGYSSDSQIKISDGSTSYYGGLSFDDAGSTRLSVRNSYDGAGSIIGFGFGSSADKVQIIDGTGLIVNEGNVGIGSTSPGYKLDVSGSGRFTGGLTLTSENPQLTFTDTTAGEDDMVLSMNGDYLEFLSNALRNIITVHGETSAYSGKVGIGTATPSNTLQVVGGVTATSFTGSLLGTATNATSASYAATSSYATNFTVAGTLTAQTLVVQTITSSIVYSSGSNIFGNSLSNTQVFTGSLQVTGSTHYLLGNVGIGTTSPSELLDVAGTIRSIAGEGRFRITSTAGTGREYDFIGGNDGIFYFYDRTATAYRYVINSSGNFGIGITNPSYKLHVAGDIYSSNVIRIGGSNPLYFDTYGGGWFMSDSTWLRSYDQKSIWIGNGYIGGDGGLTIGYGGSTPPSKGAIISGSVGIGLTSPSTALHIARTAAIAPTLRLQTTDSTTNGSVQWANSTNSVLAFIGSNSNISDASGNLEFATGGTSTKMVLTSAGRLGIGTPSPGYQLAISNAGAAGIELGASNGNYGEMYSYNRSTSAYIQLRLNGSTIALNDATGGNVGIGTTSPNNILHLYTNYAGSSNSGSAISITSDGSGGDNGWIGVNKGTGNGLTLGVENRDIIFQTDNTTAFNGTERMRITTDGNVGIGSTAPTQGKLVVNGGVYATSFTGSFSGTIAAPGSNTQVMYNNSGVIAGSSNLTFDGSTLNVTGTLTATVKSFIIDHPTKADKKLQYGVLEGPEHSVYVRGKLKNTNYIPLPDYWHALVHQDSITVTITAIGKKQDIWVNEVTEHGIYLGYEGSTVEYFYTVFAERKDIDKLVTEFDKEV